MPEEVDSELKPTDAINKPGIQLGVIAQELQQVLPDCVKQESTGVLSVDSDNLTWYLVNAVKQLSAEVESLKAQLNQGAWPMTETSIAEKISHRYSKSIGTATITGVSVTAGGNL